MDKSQPDKMTRGMEKRHSLKSDDFHFMMLYIAIARGCTSGKDYDNASP